MKTKMKRVLAWACIILLAGMYLLTLIFSLIKSEFAQSMLKASLTMTFVIPVLIYAMMLIYKVLKRRDGGEE